VNKLLGELGRRNVLRAAALYLVSAWLIAQIADVVIGLGGLPPGIGRVVLVILACGFPVALILAWLFQWTPAGVRREAATEGHGVATPAFGRRVDWVIIALLSVALVYFVAEHDWTPTAQETSPSIAVLPFENRSSLADDSFFSDGMHDDLLTQLAKIGSLVVISRTSVMRYRDSDLTIPEIALQLGVANILEGGVQRSGDRVRINMQLIEASTDRHLWAETFDRELTAENVFAIQSEIATSIAATLHATLLPGEMQRIHAIPTRSLDAYDAYLLGRRAYALRKNDQLEAAVGHFEHAIALDADFALAYAGLADTLGLLSSHWPKETADYLARAEQAAQTALLLDPNCGEAHTSLGQILKLTGAVPAKFVPELQRGIELSPGSADARKWYANYLGENHRLEEALIELQKAAELDPMSAIVRVNLAETLYKLGRYEEAEAANRKALAIDPTFMPAVAALRSLTDTAEGLVLASRQYELEPDDLWGQTEIALYYLELGDDVRAEQWLAGMERIRPGAIEALVVRMNLAQFRQQDAEMLEVANTLLPVESGYMPIPSQFLTAYDIRRGAAVAALARYEKKYPELFGNDPDFRDLCPLLADIALAQQQIGPDSKVSERLGQCLESPDLSGAEQRESALVKARIFALQGNQEAALAELRRAIAAGWRRRWFFHMRDDPAFDSLRGNPEFAALIDDLQSYASQQLLQVREFERSGEIVLPPGVVSPDGSSAKSVE
jgi:TolB-like protein/Tfp pilus assembly protein PilF